MSTHPYPINPGGTLSDEGIIGRDALSQWLVQALEQQSLILVAERRMGKTHVLRKVASLKGANQTVIRRDLESVHTAPEFVASVLSDLTEHHPLPSRFSATLREWLQKLGGTDIKVAGSGLKIPEIPPKHWKQTLQEGIALAFDGLGADQQLVFLWDELPLMLQNMAVTQGKPQEAMELLNVLRQLRQQNNNLRMVFTGSIGLHHIVHGLKAQGYANAPTNDMRTEEVPPLSLEDATLLAQKLIENNGIPIRAGQDLSALAQHIAEHVDGVGFYVHHVCAKLQKKFVGHRPLQGEGADLAEVDRIVAHATQADGHDEWELAHYRDRTQTYYGEHQAHCLSLLDAIASAPEGMSPRTLLNVAKTAHTDLSPDQWLHLIELLKRDFYVVRDEATGHLKFKFKLVLAWWRAHRAIDMQGQ